MAFDSNEWIGVVHATMPRYMKGASDLTIRSRLLLSMLRKMGRFEYNCSGDLCQWQIEYSQPPVEAYADGGVIDFANHDAFRTLAHDWRGYVTRDSLSKKQNAMNAGNEALINLFQTKSNRLAKALKDTYSGELYKDGEAAGRENNIHGLETFLGAGTVASGDRIAAPSDYYGLGSLSTATAAQGGSWSATLSTSPNSSLATDWPDGSGDAEYDCLSPKLVNWSSTAWGTGSQLWEDNSWRVVSQAITWLTTTGGPDGMPTIGLMAPNLWQGLKNHEEPIRRVQVPSQPAADLGFPGNTMNLDGCTLAPDFDCPANTAYMLNLSTVIVRSLFPELFWMEGPDKIPEQLWAWVWGLGHFGNVAYEPKNVAKLYNFAS